jgi:hypothetical protein
MTKKETKKRYMIIKVSSNPKIQVMVRTIYLQKYRFSSEKACRRQGAITWQGYGCLSIYTIAFIYDNV